MQFKIGDKVKFLNEVGHGVINRIENQIAYVEVDGFELPFKLTDLIPKQAWGTPLPDMGIHKEKKVKIPTPSPLVVTPPPPPEPLIPKQPLIERYKKGPREAEVDMHIWELTDHYRHLTNGEMVEIQLDFLKSCLQSAIEHHYTKVIFIHGVGNGTLKKEVHNYLNGFHYIEYFNAPMSEYGVGATEVHIRHNK